MMRGERKLRFPIGDRGQPLDKSLKRNISATPHRGWTKGSLSLEFGERRKTRLDSEIDSDSGLDSRDRGRLEVRSQLEILHLYGCP
ncbi:hypothetical protein AVEN_259745-1 [Araneus ventricosus]|uniref:Uncharacterized protein n=1 Tax=Araneus ventricosus TaxID=182803 RepID=A0A4Y2D2Y9_ARAVE|nr:hypothetical protein AVEN_259745-1 [Araneus ventricosus]